MAGGQWDLCMRLSHCFDPAISPSPSSAPHVKQWPSNRVAVVVWRSICRSGDKKHHRAEQGREKTQHRECKRNIKKSYYILVFVLALPTPHPNLYINSAKILFFTLPYRRTL